MYFVILGLLIMALVFGPQLWARYVFQRHNRPRPQMPGTGGELARHLIERFGLKGIKVEVTELGDHYDPQSKTVRLQQQHYQGRSLTAIAIAAHEVGHAIQDHQNSPLLRSRTRLVGFAQWTEKAGSLAMMAIPVVGLLSRSPSASALLFFLGIASLFVSTLVHLVTLPVEWDASFNKALPILKEGNYIQPQDYKAVRQILKAAALTYVAGSLASLLSLARWIAILRRR